VIGDRTGTVQVGTGEKAEDTHREALITDSLGASLVEGLSKRFDRVKPREREDALSHVELG
jgi:hypothetical protein